MAEPRGTRRLGRLGPILVVLAVVAVGLVLAIRDLRRDDRTGPDPTVAESDSCGGGTPSAVLAFDGSTGVPRWSALVGDARHLELADGVLGVEGPDRFRALDVRDGTDRWCHAYRGRSFAAGNLVGVGGLFVTDRGKRLTARRASDGAPRWTRAGTFDWVVDDGSQLLVQQGGYSVGRSRTTRGLDLATGKQRWAVTSPPAMSRGPIELPFLRTSEPALTYVFDGFGTKAVATDGAVRWSASLEQPIGLGDATLITGKALSLDLPPTRFDLRALDLATGEPRWSHEVPGTEAAVAGDVVAVRHVIDRERYNSPSMLTGYDVATGRRRWELQLGNGTQLRAAGPMLLAPAGDATGLAAIDPATGKPAWSVELDNPGRSDSHDAGSLVIDLAYDAATDTAFVLLQAQEPYRD